MRLNKKDLDPLPRNLLDILGAPPPPAPLHGRFDPLQAIYGFTPGGPLQERLCPGAPQKSVADRAALLRRAIHVSFASSLLYYALPDPIPGLGLPKACAALAFAAIVSAAEAWRLKAGWTFFLLRDYERTRPAAYYWLGLGCCFALVVFPPRFAVITILGACLVDPAIGLTRGSRWKRWASPIGFCLWLAVAVTAVAVAGLPTPLLLLPMGAAAAVAAEATRLPYLDDDFSMNLAPLALLTAAGWALGL